MGCDEQESQLDDVTSAAKASAHHGGPDAHSGSQKIGQLAAQLDRHGQ